MCIYCFGVGLQSSCCCCALVLQLWQSVRMQPASDGKSRDGSVPLHYCRMLRLERMALGVMVHHMRYGYFCKFTFQGMSLAQKPQLMLPQVSCAARMAGWPQLSWFLLSTSSSPTT